MTLEEIKTLVLSADPAAKHYETAKEGAYTTWQERRKLGLLSDDEQQEAWAFTIDRWTPEENDPVADRIEDALKNAPGAAYMRETLYDAESGYIHHVFTCEGV